MKLAVITNGLQLCEQNSQNYKNEVYEAIEMELTNLQKQNVRSYRDKVRKVIGMMFEKTLGMKQATFQKLQAFEIVKKKFATLQK